MALRQRGYLTEKYTVKSGTLLSSSGSLSGIKETIVRFYSGTTVTLNPIGKNEWSVSTTNQGLVKKAHVIKKGKRFRFEVK